MKYQHGINVMTATAEDYKSYSEVVYQQSLELLDGRIDLLEFVEDRLDHREALQEAFGAPYYPEPLGNRGKHREWLLREIPRTAAKVVSFESPGWVIEYEDTRGKHHVLCGVSMSQDASSGGVETPYIHLD